MADRSFLLLAVKTNQPRLLLLLVRVYDLFQRPTKSRVCARIALPFHVDNRSEVHEIHRSETSLSGSPPRHEKHSQKRIETQIDPGASMLMTVTGFVSPGNR